MKYLIVVLILITFFGCNSHDAKIETGVALTNLIVEKDTIDFGKINKEDSLQGIFTIKNVGPAPLYIDSIIPSCGCTVPKLSDSLVKPDYTTQIYIKFKPNINSLGHFSKSIVFQANTDDRFHVLYITGDVVPK